MVTGPERTDRRLAIELQLVSVGAVERIAGAV
jgi:hypothetical protein